MRSPAFWVLMVLTAGEPATEVRRFERVFLGVRGGLSTRSGEEWRRSFEIKLPTTGTGVGIGVYGRGFSSTCASGDAFAVFLREIPTSLASVGFSGI